MIEPQARSEKSGRAYRAENPIKMAINLVEPALKLLEPKLLGQEDELHLDLRTLTFRFTQPRGKEPRSKETLQQYRDGGSGTVLGMADSDKEREIDFWETVAELGITDDAIRTSVGRFKTKFEELDNS